MCKIDELLKKNINELESEGSGIKTGFTELDLRTYNFQEGELIVVQGAPRIGKTCFLLNVMNNVAREYAKGVLYITQDVAQTVSQKMLAINGGINLQNLHQKNLSDEQLRDLTKAVQNLSEKQIFIDDSSRPDLKEIKRNVMRINDETGLSLIIIDHDGLTSELLKKDKMKKLKELGKKIKAPILVSRKSKHNCLNTRLEPYADVGIMISRPGHYSRDTDQHAFYLDILKNTKGKEGSCRLHYVSATQQIMERMNES
jgi:replicative DNA helicase